MYRRGAGAGRRSAIIAGALCTMVLAALVPSAFASALAAHVAAAPAAHASEIGSAPGAQPLQLVFPLIANDAGLQRFAAAVTTRGSAQYGAYESIATLARRFGASPATRGRVLHYLRTVGARDVRLDATGLFVDATISAGLAQRLFATPLAQFRTADDIRFIAPAATAAGAAAVSVPAPLRGLVAGVVGLDTRPLFGSPAPSMMASRARAAAHAAQAQPTSLYGTRTGTPSGCGAGLASGGFTPNQYLTAYGYGPLIGAGQIGTGERVALIEVDGFRYSDITTFARCFGLSVPPINGFGVGVSQALPPGGESTLDVELLDAAAPGLKAIDVFESGPRAAQALRALTAPLQARAAKPQVISASLGLCEQQLLGSVGVRALRATEGALEMAAASGITFLASSGDTGSADCTRPNGTPLDHLAVNYPASSRWVTGVGGTNFVLNAANQITRQVVWNDTNVDPGAAGGGGFSVAFGRPSYQNRTVARRARAVPDVSLLSDVAPGYSIYCTAAPDCVNAQSPNPWTTVGGTSAATPLLAGGFALVDQELHRSGRRDLGLVNPLLYAIGRSPLSRQVFSDVTQYGNDIGPYIAGGAGPLGCCRARRGFDEASGLGSVDIARFAAVALSAQPRIVALRLTLRRDRRPVRYGRILATVSCSGARSIAAFVKVRIARQRPFVISSKVVRLRRKGARTFTLRFSARELTTLRAALARHRPIVVDVVGAIIGSGGRVEAHTRVRRLTIRG